MRKNLITFSLLICGLAVFSSCKSSKESVAQRKADIELSKDAGAGCYVQLNDGTTRNYRTLVLVKKMFSAPYLLADGKQKISANEITAYQNNEHYAISQKNFVSGHKTYVAKETLPGFAIRIAKGKINVYAKKYYNGSIAVDEYFVQKGNDGQIHAYTAESMNMLVKDDEEALAFFVNKQYPTSKTLKVTETASYAKNGKVNTRPQTNK